MYQTIKWHLILLSGSQRQQPFPPAFISSLLLLHLNPNRTSLVAGLWTAIHAPFFCAHDSLGTNYFSDNPPTSSSLLFLCSINEVIMLKNCNHSSHFCFSESVYSPSLPPCTHIRCVSDTQSFPMTANFMMVGPFSILSSVLYPMSKTGALYL